MGVVVKIAPKQAWPAPRPTKASLVQGYQQWDIQGRCSPPTPELLAGLFYIRYRERYRLYPVSDIADDLKHFHLLLNEHLAEEPTLAPYVVEALCQQKAFDSLSARSFSNPRVIAGWKLIERATKLRSGRGEQAEFTGPRAYGTTRV